MCRATVPDVNRRGPVSDRGPVAKDRLRLACAADGLALWLGGFAGKPGLGGGGLLFGHFTAPFVALFPAIALLVTWHKPRHDDFATIWRDCATSATGGWPGYGIPDLHLWIGSGLAGEHVCANGE